MGTAAADNGTAGIYPLISNGSSFRDARLTSDSEIPPRSYCEVDLGTCHLRKDFAICLRVRV